MAMATLTIYPHWPCTNLIGWSCRKRPIRSSVTISMCASLWCLRPVSCRSTAGVYWPVCIGVITGVLSQVCGAARLALRLVWRTEMNMWIWERQRRVHNGIKTSWFWSTPTDKPVLTARETGPPLFASDATQTKWFVVIYALLCILTNACSKVNTITID